MAFRGNSNAPWCLKDSSDSGVREVTDALSGVIEVVVETRNGIREE